MGKMEMKRKKERKKDRKKMRTSGQNFATSSFRLCAFRFGGVLLLWEATLGPIREEAGCDDVTWNRKIPLWRRTITWVFYSCGSCLLSQHSVGRPSSAREWHLYPAWQAGGTALRD